MYNCALRRRVSWTSFVSMCVFFELLWGVPGRTVYDRRIKEFISRSTLSAVTCQWRQTRET